MMNPLVLEPTNLEEYMTLVMRGIYPQNPMVKRAQPFINDAGSIENVALGQFGGVAVIRSKAGAIRSNHYHRTDWHFMIVLDGVMAYFSKKLDETAISIVRMEADDIVFTPPEVLHASYFPEPTTIIAVSRLARTHEQHEADLIRMPLIMLDEQGDLIFAPEAAAQGDIPRVW